MTYMKFIAGTQGWFNMYKTTDMITREKVTIT